MMAAAAGCTSAERMPEVPAELSAASAYVVYEVAGDAALPLAAGLAARASRPAILPAGFIESDGAAGAEAVVESLPKSLYGRLELRRVGQNVAARLSVYDRRPELVRPKSPVKREPSAASRRAARPEPPAPWLPATSPLAVYELELPAAELSLVLDDLDAAGAFDVQERPEGGARLAVGPSDEAALKEWTPEPRLDDLAERVLREGSHVPAPLPGGVGQARVMTPGASR